MLRGRLYAPTGAMWDSALVWWRQLHSDPDAVFDMMAASVAQGYAAKMAKGEKAL